ncbi:MAG: isoleucine--tRNA ligase [Phycisphaeraceae bacterium]|nr:isoleucine--tRNA ligase [Phycisphaeraceae bacterium]
MTETTSKRSYKDTVNLPRTDFAMRAGLATNEPRSRQRWQARDVYAEVQRRRAGAAPFVFHDGPPYANGSIHVGHLLNKVLKDIVVRSRLMAGRACPFIPGWDCHGLPIEHRVVTEMAADGRLSALERLSADESRMAIRRACRERAEHFVAHQADQMQRLLTLADYAHPYLTMAPGYERAVLEVFAELVEQGIVFRALKPVHWSIANRTALAEAELEYEDREDDSIFVDFEADDIDETGRRFGVELDQRPSFMIWTTTPWTLPANVAVAVHPRVVYALVRMDGAISIIADELVERVTRSSAAQDVERLGTAPGEALLGLGYRHPFRPRTGRVVAAEYVTTEDGTGLVHTAPGHGVEDYQTGLRESLPIDCPVQEDGTFDDTVPQWLRGVDVWTANGRIIEALRTSGHLVHAMKFMHAYPHDWRSRTPVIFRATEQWFIGVDAGLPRCGTTLRRRATTAAASEIRFVPDWGRNRLRGMLESRPDWCISRQRAWGLPIPAFRTPDGRVLLTPATVRAVAAVIGDEGSDAWFTRSAAELLAHWRPETDPQAPRDVDVRTLEKAYDIFDVWFESGSSWAAVLRARGLGLPADLYLEGSDQHRGWFQLSLLPALAATGQPPFRTLLTHGFMVDRDGRKMSKSLGNALDVDTLLAEHGADVCRWWVSSLAYENDIKVDEAFFRTAGESYRKIRNTVRFLLSNLHDFTPASDRVDLASLDPCSLDAWLVGEAAHLDAEVRSAFEAFEFRRAHQAIYDFCNDTLSAIYCAAVKDRLYCDAPGSPRRRATQSAMHIVADMLCRLLAPIMPHTADEAYQALVGSPDACVHLETFVTLPPVAPDPGWTAVMAARSSALRAMEAAKADGIENPLDAEVVLPDPDGALRPFEPELADLLGVSRVRLDPDGGPAAPRVVSLAAEPRCERSRKRDGTVRPRRDGGMLSDRDARALGLE